MYCLAASAQIVFIGSLFWMCHQLIVTGPSEDFVAADELGSSEPPQPATTAAAATIPSALRTDFTIVSLLLHRMPCVLWRTTSVVASSTRRSSLCPSTSRAAVAAISVSGWRIVVSGGPT